MTALNATDTLWSNALAGDSTSVDPLCCWLMCDLCCWVNC